MEKFYRTKHVIVIMFGFSLLIVGQQSYADSATMKPKKAIEKKAVTKKMPTKATGLKELETSDKVASAKNDEKLVVIEFFAPWCGHCQKFTPKFEKLTKDDGNKTFVGYKVNADEHKDIAAEYSIQGYPTVIIFKDGKEAKRLEGPNDVSEIRQHVDFLNKK